MDNSLISKFDWNLAIPLILIISFLIYGWIEHVKRTPESDLESRLPLFNRTMFMLWGLSLTCLAGWYVSYESFSELGLVWPKFTWLNGIAWAIVGLAIAYFLYALQSLRRSKTTRDQARKQINQADLDFMRPRNRPEHRRFRFLSITAGITEEIIFRGFLIAVLSLVLPLPVAAVLAIIIFGLGHIYQGVAGILRTSLLGGVLTLVYLMGGSLWPAIILHIIIDLAAGAQFQLLDIYEDKDNRDTIAEA